MMSETLEQLGFAPAIEARMSITRSPNTADRGTFYQGDFAGVENTVAIDESGEIWVINGHIDLAPHGFKRYVGEKVQ